MRLRALLFALLMLGGINVAYAAQGSPELAIESTGICRNFSVYDGATDSWVPIGCLNSAPAVHRFEPAVSYGTGSLRLGTNSLALDAGAGTGGNVAVGQDTLSTVITGNSYTAVGDRACGDVVDGDNPLLPGRATVCLGFVAGQFAKGPNSNTWIGAFAGRGDENDIPTGNQNTCVGEACALAIAGPASNNTGIGFNALFDLRHGELNSAVGVGALFSVYDSSQNSGVGVNVYKWGDGDRNTMFGQAAGNGFALFSFLSAAVTAGDTVIHVVDATQFTAGHEAVAGSFLAHNTRVVSVNTGANTITVDTPATINVTGNFSIVVVWDLADRPTGDYNSGFGYGTLLSLSGDAEFNSSFGSLAAQNMRRGYRNVFMGAQVAGSCVTCADSVVIGYGSDVPAADSTRALNIGRIIYGAGIGNSSHADDFLGVAQETPLYTLDVGGPIASRGTAAALLLERNTAGLSAPGAGLARIRLQCGTNAGTIKIVAVAGTSATAVTIADNVGAGNTGC